MTKKREETFSLSVDSSYLIRSAESIEKPLITRGKLRGYATLGQETGITVELDESHGEDQGKLRIIPLHVILSVDILSTEKKKDEEEEPQDTLYYS